MQHVQISHAVFSDFCLFCFKMGSVCQFHVQKSLPVIVVYMYIFSQLQVYQKLFNDWQ